MGKNSKIQWTDHTFNPWIGCTKVSTGCVNCYAEREMDKHWHKVQWGPQGSRVRTSAAMWKQPLKWNKDTWWECVVCGYRGGCSTYADVSIGRSPSEFNAHCPKCGSPEVYETRQRVFCASLADLGDHHPSVLNEWIEDLVRLITQTPNLNWMLLTKRPEDLLARFGMFWGLERFPENVWVGVSVENQKCANERVPALLRVPARTKFLSCEPLLGKVNLPLLARDERGTWNEQINWVIIGGESGTNARPMNPDWARSIRDQCQDAGVRFFFKQWGEHVPLDHLPWATDKTTFKHKPVEIEGAMMCRIGKGLAGRVLDGREWSEIPQGYVVP